MSALTRTAGDRLFKKSLRQMQLRPHDQIANHPPEFGDSFYGSRRHAWRENKRLSRLTAREQGANEGFLTFLILAGTVFVPLSVISGAQKQNRILCGLVGAYAGSRRVANVVAFDRWSESAFHLS